MNTPIRIVGPFLFVPLLLAQKPNPKVTFLPAHPIVQHPEDRASSSLIMEEMPLVAPLFIEDHGTKSVLALVNNGIGSAGATISVRNLQGLEIAHQKIVLKPHENRNLPVASLFSSGSSPHYGSISVVQDSDLNGPAIAAQLLMTDESNTTPAYVDEELAMPNMEGSSVFRSVTDESSGPPLLAVTNLSASAQKITVRCIGAKTQKQTSSTLAPLATSLTSACSGAFVPDLTQFLSATQSASSYGVTGIEISGDGGAGQLAAFAIAPHLRNTDTVFSAVPFSDPALIYSPDIVFAGVPIGPQPTLPDGLYIPRISLSNFSSTPAHVTVSLNVTARSRIGSSDNTSSIRDPQTISSITIPAESTQEVLFSGTESQSGLLNSVYISSDRQPGDLQAKLVSRSSGSLYEIELLGKDFKDINNGGVHPWTVQGDAESHLILYNHSKGSKKFYVAISSGTTVWEKTYSLDASETLELSFNQLIRDKSPDDKHQTLDPTQTQGVVNWTTTNSGDATGRLMVTSRGSMMARNFSCGNISVICSGYLEDYSDYIQVSDSSQLYSLIPNFCASWNPGQCNGNQQSGGGANFYSTINDTSIVAFNDSSQPYSQSPMLLGMGPGSTYIILNASENGCQTSATGGPTAQVPTSLPVVRTVNNSAASCPAGQAGWDRSVYRQVEDQNGNPITTQYKTIHESFSNGPGPNPFNITITTADGQTDITGQVPDEFNFCSPQCPSSTSTSTFTQTVTEPDTNATFQLGSYVISYSCSNIKVNGSLTP